MLTVNECMALYAGGPFGEIAEVYIVPAYRSSSIGGRLVDAAGRLWRSEPLRNPFGNGPLIFIIARDFGRSGHDWNWRCKK